MRTYHFVTVRTNDGKSYYYDIYIRGESAAIKEAKRQLCDIHGYDESDIVSATIGWEKQTRRD